MAQAVTRSRRTRQGVFGDPASRKGLVKDGWCPEIAGVFHLCLCLLVPCPTRIARTPVSADYAPPLLPHYRSEVFLAIQRLAAVRHPVGRRPLLLLSWVGSQFRPLSFYIPRGLSPVLLLERGIPTSRAGAADPGAVQGLRYGPVPVSQVSAPTLVQGPCPGMALRCKLPEVEGPPPLCGSVCPSRCDRSRLPQVFPTLFATARNLPPPPTAFSE